MGKDSEHYPGWGDQAQNPSGAGSSGGGGVDGDNGDDQLALAAGTMLHGGRYMVLAVITGSVDSEFSIVYLAEQIALNRKVAIKEYFPRKFVHRTGAGTITTGRHATNARKAFEEGKMAFEREARHLSEITHPFIVNVRDVFSDHGTVYFVMDFIDGHNLSETAQEGLTADTTAFLHWFSPLLDAIEVLHNAKPPIFHRDIKPQNIQIRRTDKRPVLLDFGAARAAVGSATLTKIYTPGYAPPEQTANLPDPGTILKPALDIYALAATAYDWLTGEVPPDSSTRSHFTMYGSADPLVPLSDKVKGGRIDARLLAILDQSLQLRAKDRPQTVRELKSVVETLQRAPGPPRKRIPAWARGTIGGFLAGALLTLPAVLIPMSIELEKARNAATGNDTSLHEALAQVKTLTEALEIAKTRGETAVASLTQEKEAVASLTQEKEALAEQNAKLSKELESLRAAAAAGEAEQTAAAATAAAAKAAANELAAAEKAKEDRMARIRAFLEGSPVNISTSDANYKRFSARLTRHGDNITVDEVRFQLADDWASPALRSEMLEERRFELLAQVASRVTNNYDWNKTYRKVCCWTIPDDVTSLSSRDYVTKQAMELPLGCTNESHYYVGGCTILFGVSPNKSGARISVIKIDLGRNFK